MKIKKSNLKKGEMTINQIVFYVTVIAGFAIVLFYLTRLNIGSVTDKEICRTSILTASQKGLLGNLAKSGIVCKTNYLCISGGGECFGMIPSETVNVKLENNPHLKEDVMKIIANEMVSCWDTYGKGNLLYGKEGLGQESLCAACSKISFDNSLRETNKGIIYGEFEKYLKETDIEENSETYFEHFCYFVTETGKTGQENEIEKCILEDGGRISGETLLSFNKNYYLIQALRNPGTINEFVDRVWFVSGDPVEEFDVMMGIYPEEDVSKMVKCDKYLTLAS